MYRIGSAVALAASVIASALGAQTVVTPSNPQGWSSATFYGATGNDPGTGASSGITTTYPHNGNGSVEITLQDEGNSEADWIYNFSGNQALGSLSTLSFDWYTSSTSTTPNFTSPAFALAMSDGSYFVWEAAYNGMSGGVPMDVWNSSNIAGGTFWFTGNGTGLCDTYGEITTLSQLNSDCYAGAGQVTGIDVFLGYGYSGAYYDGAIDNVAYGFGTVPATDFNFEADVSNVTPEPATMSLLGFGLVGLAGLGRRRKLR